MEEDDEFIKQIGEGRVEAKFHTENRSTLLSIWLYDNEGKIVDPMNQRGHSPTTELNNALREAMHSLQAALACIDAKGDISYMGFAKRSHIIFLDKSVPEFDSKLEKILVENGYVKSKARQVERLRDKSLREEVVKALEPYVQPNQLTNATNAVMEVITRQQGRGRQ